MKIYILNMEYKDLTLEKINKAVGEFFYRKAETEDRKVKLYVSFQSEEAARKWFKEFDELVQKEFERTIYER